MIQLFQGVKPMLLHLAWLAMLPLSALQCDKKKTPENCIRGKNVRITCVNTVIEVLNEDKLGEDNWKDGTVEDKTYNNVLSVANKCDIPATIKTSDELTFRLGESGRQDCIV